MLMFAQVVSVTVRVFGLDVRETGRGERGSVTSSHRFQDFPRSETRHRYLSKYYLVHPLPTFPDTRTIRFYSNTRIAIMNFSKFSRKLYHRWLKAYQFILSVNRAAHRIRSGRRSFRVNYTNIVLKSHHNILHCNILLIKISGIFKYR